MKMKTWLALTGAQLFFVAVANAQTGGGNGVNGLQSSPISDVAGLKTFLCNLAGYFAWFILAISVIMILYAAYTYITAGDDTEKTSKARRIITYAAVGIAVALLANAFPAIVESIFPNSGSGVSASYCT